MPAEIGPGVPMIGSYTNVMLYTLEFVEAYIYYFASPRSMKDPIFLKCCVATSLVSDTVGTIGVCALSFITNLVFSDVITPRRIYWAFQMYIVGNIVSAFIFQSYMVHRLWILSRNYVICTFITLLILVSFGMGLGLIAENLEIVTVAVLEGNKIRVHAGWIIVVLSTAMATDVSITTALLWQLNRSGLYNRQNLQTRRLVARISSLAIKTGVVPCVFALAILVTYVSYSKNANLAIFFAYMLGRVYTSTMLYSLIYRDKLYSGGELMNVESTSLPSMTFSYDSESSPPPPQFRIPPLALSKGRPGHDSMGGSPNHKSYDKSYDLTGTSSNPISSYSHTFEGTTLTHHSNSNDISLAEPG